MNDLLISLMEWIDVIVGGNEFASGIIVGGLFGTVTYLARNVPLFLFKQLIKHTTTQMTLNSTNESFHELNKYFNSNGLVNRSRFVKVGNGRFGWDKTNKEIGYGTQLFWLSWNTPIMVRIYKEDSQSQNVKEFMTLTKIGRNHLFFDNLIEKIRLMNIDNSKFKIYKYDNDCMRYLASEYKRTFSSIIMTEKSEKYLTNGINNFIDNEDWFIEKSIPYQLGILLYGPPGTGKTSIIRAIASYTNLDICYVDNIASLSNACSSVNNSIIVAEEIDTFGLKNRGNTDIISSDDEEKEEHDSLEEMLEGMSTSVLGKILSSLDGVVSNHGRIVVMTTNHINRLDPALIRPGRIDLKVELGYICSETLDKILMKFYDEHVPGTFYEINGHISPADIQNDVMCGLTYSDVISKYKLKKLIVDRNHK